MAFLEERPLICHPNNLPVNDLLVRALEHDVLSPVPRAIETQKLFSNNRKRNSIGPQDRERDLVKAGNTLSTISSGGETIHGISGQGDDVALAQGSDTLVHQMRAGRLRQLLSRPQPPWVPARRRAFLLVCRRVRSGWYQPLKITAEREMIRGEALRRQSRDCHLLLPRQRNQLTHAQSFFLVENIVCIPASVRSMRAAHELRAPLPRPQGPARRPRDRADRHRGKRQGGDTETADVSADVVGEGRLQAVTAGEGKVMGQVYPMPSARFFRTCLPLKLTSRAPAALCRRQGSRF